MRARRGGELVDQEGGPATRAEFPRGEHPQDLTLVPSR